MTNLRTTPSQENYVEWIYRLSQTAPVRPSHLAERLGVSRASVSRAVASLEQKGLVSHEAYGDITLTPGGEFLGREIVRRDECLTRLLVEVLAMSPEAANSEVHRLEHAVSREVLLRLEALVAFSTSSEAWLRRLRTRIEAGLSADQKSDNILIGCGEIHQGDPIEKGKDFVIEDLPQG